VSVDPRNPDMTGPINRSCPRRWTWAERDVRSVPKAADTDGGTLARFAAVVRQYNRAVRHPDRNGRRIGARWSLVSR
jgi:hypothetical protein